MNTLLYKFTLQNAKFNQTVLLCALFLWIVLIACAVASINSQPYPKKQRSFWIMLVICVPIVGLLAYLPFSFRKEEIPQMFLAKRDRQKRERERLHAPRSDK